MVTYRKNVFSCHVNFLNGKKCIFLVLIELLKLRKVMLIVPNVLDKKSLKKLRLEIAILQRFYRQQPVIALLQTLVAIIKPLAVFTKKFVK